MKENAGCKELEKPGASSAFEFGKSYLGSRKRTPTTTAAIVAVEDDPAFTNFFNNLTTVLTQIRSASGVTDPLKFTAEDKAVSFRIHLQ